MNSVFDFVDYRLYLKHQIETNRAERGYQSRLAEAAGCKRSFLSQVLHTHINFTPDHAAGLCQFWALPEDEVDWFMELISLSRAGSPVLQKLCQRRLNAFRKKRADLSLRLKPQKTLTQAAQMDYYASWHWAAIHILSSIPLFQTSVKIAARLGLRESLVKETLTALEKMGLVEQNGSRYQASVLNMHIPKTSRLNGVNHVNWRQRAIAKIQTDSRNSFHYTAVHSLSLKDIPKLQEKLIATIQDLRDTVAPSPEEDLVCFTCDLFRI